MLFVAGCLAAFACKSPPAQSASKSTSETFAPLAVGDTIAAYAAQTLAGDTIRLGANEPVTLVNVWATWCESCREEMSDLEDLTKRFGPKGLRVVAVSVDEGDGDRVRRFAEHEKLTMTVVHDPASRIQEIFSTVGVPESYLVSANGTLLWRQAGGLHGDPGQAAAAIEHALAGPVEKGQPSAM
jgi:thiol-disulfide isomerase/thioredoxin